MPAASHAVMPASVGSTRGYSRAGSSPAKAGSSLAPVASRTRPGLSARYAAARAASASTTLPAGSWRAQQTVIFNSAAAAAARMDIARCLRGIGVGRVNAERRTAQQRRHSFGVQPPGVHRDAVGAALFLGPSSVATQTVTAAPSAATWQEKLRPSVVPLKITTFIRRDTPGRHHSAL